MCSNLLGFRGFSLFVVFLVTGLIAPSFIVSSSSFISSPQSVSESSSSCGMVMRTTQHETDMLMMHKHEGKVGQVCCTFSHFLCDFNALPVMAEQYSPLLGRLTRFHDTTRIAVFWRMSLPFRPPIFA